MELQDCSSYKGLKASLYSDHKQAEVLDMFGPLICPACRIICTLMKDGICGLSFFRYFLQDQKIEI